MNQRSWWNKNQIINTSLLSFKRENPLASVTPNTLSVILTLGPLKSLSETTETWNPAKGIFSFESTLSKLGPFKIMPISIAALLLIWKC